jgi:hypothetical protein
MKAAGFFNDTISDAIGFDADSGMRLQSDNRPLQVVRVALADADTGGGVLAWQNPETSTIVIERVEIYTTTASTGAGTIDVGTTATSAATSSDNLIDGLDVNAAAGIFDNITDKGTNGKSRQTLASGKWVTASKATGAMAGLVGYAYLYYHKV